MKPEVKTFVFVSIALFIEILINQLKCKYTCTIVITKCYNSEGCGNYSSYIWKQLWKTSKWLNQLVNKLTINTNIKRMP